jgi:3-phosphoinositide dependent protein kinase-1
LKDFILEYCPNGELLDLIKKAGRFDETVATFYAAEIIQGLEFMHEKNIVHRDLKPGISW